MLILDIMSPSTELGGDENPEGDADVDTASLQEPLSPILSSRPSTPSALEAEYRNAPRALEVAHEEVPAPPEPPRAVDDHWASSIRPGVRRIY